MLTFGKRPGFPDGSDGKESTCNVNQTWVRSLGWEGPLEEGVATHSSILAWRIPWIEELGGFSPWGRKEVTEATQHACSMLAAV